MTTPTTTPRADTLSAGPSTLGHSDTWPKAWHDILARHEAAALLHQAAADLQNGSHDQ